MMKSEDKLIKEIEDSLHAYEEAYEPGAWEAFQQKQKRRGAAMWFLRAGTAAAILLLLGYGALHFFNKPNVNTQFAQHKNKLQQPDNKESRSTRGNILPDTTRPENNVAVTGSYRDNPEPSRSIAGVDSAQPMQSADKYLATNNKPVAVTKDSNLSAAVSTNKAVKQPVVINDTATSVRPSAVNETQNGVLANNQPEKIKQDDKPLYDLLTKNKIGERTANTSKQKVKSLSYAVMVSPALGSQKINFGTGVQVFYNINKNLSVSSGIGYSSLKATATADASGDPLTKVQGADLAVSGFEVPVGVQYRTNNGYYVSAGVVGMSVKNNHLDYSYLTQSTVAASIVDATGLTQPAIRVVSKQTTEESNEKINNYLGFYILSVGKKKAIGQHNQINFGPFLRVPFGAVSSQKVNLTQGGIHLGFEF